MKKKSISLIIALALTASAFAACSGGDNSSQTGEPTAAPSQNQDSQKPQEGETPAAVTSDYEPGRLPISDEKKEISIMIDAPTEDVETNWTTQYMEELTNVHVNWKQVPAEQFMEKLSLLVVSGEKVDGVQRMMKATDTANFVNQGLFRPIDDLIEDYSLHYKKTLEDYPDLKKALTLPDGKIYAVGQASQTFHAYSNLKFWINEQWIDNLGMEIPKTPDELYEVLKAFKEGDPNGNGIADELPLVGLSKNDDNNAIDGFLMAPFQFTDTQSNRLYIDDGVVKASYTQDGYKEGLEYLAKLYDEGLMAPQSFTLDRAGRTALNQGSDENIVGSTPAFNVGSFNVLPNETKWHEYAVLPPLVGADGVAKAPDYTYQRMESAFYITTMCEDPALVLLWIEQRLNDSEIGFSLQFGKQGTTWDWAETGELGSDGEQARYKIIAFEDITDQEFIDQYGKNYTSPMNSPTINTYYHSKRMMTQDIHDITGQGLERLLWLSTVPYMDAKVSLDTMMPNLYYSSDVIGEVANLQVVLNDAVEQNLATIVTGGVDLDTGWDNFQKEIKGLGIDRYLELVQEAYDIWNQN